MQFLLKKKQKRERERKTRENSSIVAGTMFLAREKENEWE
jgi:hypothetical protein